VLSSVEVLRQCDRSPRRHTGTVSARVATRHATGVQRPPLELSATAPVQANHLETGGVVRSSVEVLRQGDRAPRRHTGPVSARGAARHVTGGAAPATRAERHNPCASQPPRDWRCGAVQCRGAAPGRPGARGRGGTQAPCRRGWLRAGQRGVQHPPTRAERHSPCTSQPLRGWRCGAVQCRGAPPGRPGARCRGRTRAPCRRGWPRATPRGCSTRHSS